MNEYDRTWPAVYFLYYLSPITVTIKEERQSFLHFITRLCAVLCGTFALTGLS
ncbi:putative endoplasmic reticulum vesicle transporter [Helianthus debilis subsp. tardiflorus]